MNFETHYLSHYRVIPLQSFGSLIHTPLAARIRVNSILFKNTTKQIFISQRARSMNWRWDRGNWRAAWKNVQPSSNQDN